MSEHIQSNANTSTNNNDILLKEIDLIQSCINRMAQNSFVIKGWTISLNGIILGLFFDKAQNCIVPLICLLAVVLFWWLDAFFLRTAQGRIIILKKEPDFDTLFGRERQEKGKEKEV